MSPYVPLVIMLGIGMGFAALSIIATSLIGPARYNRAKLESYECGIDPTPPAGGGGKVPIKFFLIAMLFIVFDVETVFLFPYAVAFNRLGIPALVAVLVFVGAVLLAYAYVWRRGGLEWE